MTTGTLKINSENILPIIKKWLYSDKDIFVRELVSNACDALRKVKVLRDKGEATALDEEFRIDINIDAEAKTLTFSDTGIGMDAAEVEKYIAEIAFSGAEDFVKKYTSDNEEDHIIGNFGLGFYSSYMAAEKVSIDTLSYKEGAEATLWTCDGGSDYTLDAGTRASRGTTITLYVMDDEKEFLEEARLSEILNKYSSFLPFPIYLNDKRINEKEPLWVKAPSDCTDEEYLDFYRHMYPTDPEPLFWIHLNVDYPFNLKGILYFPKLRRDFDFTKNATRLFCNRVFVSDDCKDLIPDYLVALRGAIDSPDIPLNVSRSYLQKDRTVRQLANHISKKVSDRLSTLYKGDRDKFLTCWKDIEVIIKLGALQDDKFYSRVKDFIVWKNTEAEWTTTEEYLERNKDKNENKIYYTFDDTHSSHMLSLYKERGLEVLHTNTQIDNHFIAFLEGKLSPTKFQRIDSGLDDNILDKDKEKSVLDADGRTEAARIVDIVKAQVEEKNIEVEAKSLASTALPGFIMFDESSRRLRDSFKATNSEINDWSAFEKKTFVVNTNNPLIESLGDLKEKDPALVKDLVLHVYDLALLSQREMSPEALNSFIERSSHVMEKLATAASK
jgi:molecular chaperone HtpG